MLRGLQKLIPCHIENIRTRSNTSSTNTDSHHRTNHTEHGFRRLLPKNNTSSQDSVIRLHTTPQTPFFCLSLPVWILYLITHLVLLFQLPAIFSIYFSNIGRFFCPPSRSLYLISMVLSKDYSLIVIDLTANIHTWVNTYQICLCLSWVGYLNQDGVF